MKVHNDFLSVVNSNYKARKHHVIYTTQNVLAAIFKIEYAQLGSHFDKNVLDESFKIGLAEEGLSDQKILKEI